MDMLDESDARPDDTSTVAKRSESYRKVRVVEEVAENGEAILELTNGDTVEVHGHDAYFYDYEGVIFTEYDDAETWIFEDVDVETMSDEQTVVLTKHIGKSYGGTESRHDE